MGLCNSKSLARKAAAKQVFNPVDSYQSTRSMLHDDHKKNKSKISNVRELKRSNTENSCNDDNIYDENSIDSYEIEHQILKDVWKGNFCSGISEELQNEQKHVLDVACGRGHWIREMSKEFPNSYFTGIHASPGPKVESPHNTAIVAMDILNRFTYGDDSFDYVHMRCLDPNFTENQWKKIIHEIVRVTKPQGIVEIVVGGHECEDSGPTMKKLCTARRVFLETNDIKTDIINDLENLMFNTKKFVSLEKQIRKIPIGKSFEKVGEMFHNYFSYIIESYHESLSSYLGKSPEEFNEMMVSLNEELDKFKNSNFQCVRIFGKKI
ncbi:S-adenosyl-L-methionine-dependent methyltransferase [Gigaspora margarita]|uniref:S-adenosyl-L-methionine-dependent methyltransferase n=1 Tax=Gigaspora margarita TaxID=4874 RepID=A0A8H4AIS1_GIGMA|nr:S-adenosyl-L-methionine-dependent methyltransferase [Gigaspora margarita]